MNKRAFAAVAAVILAGCGGGSTGAGDAGSGRDAGNDGGTLPDGGASCTSDAQCPGGDYCAGTGCGTSGACAAIPASCPPDVSQVCGCDGAVYSNACKAFLAGTRVFANGACQSSQCAGVFQMIEGAVEASQACSANGDCHIDRTPDGVGPCWAAVNTSTDAQLQTLEGQYASDGCGQGVVGSCTFLPGGAVCDAGQCTSN